MVKKRRFTASASASGASSPRVRTEVKEENTPGGVEVSSARDRLKGALQVILEHSDEESASSAEETETVARQPAIKKEPAAPHAQSLKTLRQQQRRRRRRELLAEGAFHHTYVMKLFDRSVDLAQFKEDTPLYPVCRAWMANQPHNTSLVPKTRTPTPEPAPEEEPVPPADEEQEASGEGGNESGGEDADLVKDTYKMPPPQPLPEDPQERKRLKIPSPLIRAREGVELDYEVKAPVPREVLLHDHLIHWTAVRKKWHEASHKNSARFEESTRILRAIYRKAQKAFES